MRIATYSLIFTPLLLCFAASKAADAGEAEEDAEAEAAESEPQGTIEDRRSKKLFGTLPDRPPPSFTGCDDYLTNKSTESYCSKTVPDEWASFEFEREEYFMVPLAGRFDEFTHTNKSLQQTGKD